jgi:hypothetical protein
MKASKTNVDHRYISYFQSVLTIGIMSNGKSMQEAEKKSSIKIKDKSGVNYCVFEQTPFELTDTEEWKPEFEPEETPDGIKFRFDPDEKTKNVIATRLGKDIGDLTDSDLEDFIKQSIEIALKKINI